jgi:Bacterial sugar transferase
MTDFLAWWGGAPCWIHPSEQTWPKSGTRLPTYRTTNWQPVLQGYEGGGSMLRSETYRSERRRVQAPTSCLQSLSKRGFDLVVATAGLLLLSPLIIFVSLGIRFAFSKPILCQQKRYNSNNVEFGLFEFRIRHVDQQEQRLNRRLDQIRCCTSIGRFLCRSGLNKLPQLLNVLRGKYQSWALTYLPIPPGLHFRLST